MAAKKKSAAQEDMDEAKRAERTYRLFEIFLWAKGAFALLELAGGLAAFFVHPSFVERMAGLVTRGELGEDPNDFVANHVLALAHSYAIGQHVAVALYLLSHGVVKLALVVALLRGKMWAYPTSLVVFAALAGYQLYLYTANQSLTLLAVTLVDIALIWLIWREWRIVRAQQMV